MSQKSNVLEICRSVNKPSLFWLVFTISLASFSFYVSSSVLLFLSVFLYVLMSYNYFVAFNISGIIYSTTLTQCFWSLFGLPVVVFSERLFMFVGKYICEFDTMSKFKRIFGYLFLKMFMGFTLAQIKEIKEFKEEE